jgi:mRNA interferase MazF
MSETAWAPDRAEVIFIDFSPHAGSEMSRMHPMLVISPRSYNEATGHVIGVPMTHAGYNARNPFAVRIPDPPKGDSFILSDMVKSLDWQARNARLHPLGTVPPTVFETVLQRLNAILQLT